MAEKSDLEPMQRYLDEINDEKITIVVGQGDDLKSFKISRASLCKKSTWFTNALKEGRFFEGISRTICLPEDSSAVFTAFEYYTHLGDLAFKDLEFKTEGVPEEFSYCFKIWIFGDKYDIPGLQNCAMMRICEILKWSKETLEDAGEKGHEIPIDTLAMAFQETVEQSPLRRLVAYYVLEKINGDAARKNDLGALGTLEGFAFELLDAQSFIHLQAETDFALYLQPVKHKHLFCAAGSQESNAEQATTWESYYNLDIGYSAQPTCTSCGLWSGETRCMTCKKRVFSCSSCQCMETTFVCVGCSDIDQ